MGKKIKGKDLIELGFPQNNAMNIALGQISRYRKKEKKEAIILELKQVLIEKENFVGHAVWGKVVEGLIKPLEIKRHELKTQRAPYQIYGENEIDEPTKWQLFEALKLPISVTGALMPDAHSGYGLPIGGVLATDNAVIPYGVGVDIGCSMHLSVFHLPASYFQGREHQLKNMLSEHTKFGMYETHQTKIHHEVLDSELFKEIPLLKSLHSKAIKQLGTSGGGNHFVEFGVTEIDSENVYTNIPAGKYFSILSHSGSRALGANIAKHYTYLATKQCPLPKQVQHLAWLDLNSHDGMEYWLSMNLAGDYAKACHENIHYRLAKLIGARPILQVFNTHNFAWKETVNGNECIVHRKGATPAHQGQLGIIPGSMTSPGYIVMGKGNSESVNSASHGAGRLYSRNVCKQKFTPSEIKKHLKEHEVTLIGGNVDEAPMAYKDINKVMANQNELVTILGTFTPKIVRMDK